VIRHDRPAWVVAYPAVYCRESIASMPMTFTVNRQVRTVETPTPARVRRVLA